MTECCCNVLSHLNFETSAFVIFEYKLFNFSLLIFMCVCCIRNFSFMTKDKKYFQYPLGDTKTFSFFNLTYLIMYDTKRRLKQVSFQSIFQVSSIAMVQTERVKESNKLFHEGDVLQKPERKSVCEGVK